MVFSPQLFRGAFSVLYLRDHSTFLFTFVKNPRIYEFLVLEVLNFLYSTAQTAIPNTPRRRGDTKD